MRGDAPTAHASFMHPAPSHNSRQHGLHHSGSTQGRAAEPGGGRRCGSRPWGPSQRDRRRAKQTSRPDKGRSASCPLHPILTCGTKVRHGNELRCTSQRDRQAAVRYLGGRIKGDAQGTDQIGVRRLMPVRMALIALVTMMPELFAGCAPTVTAMRLVLGTGSALVALREVGAAHLGALPPPLGFGPRRKGGWRRWGDRQHDMGPDPPS